MSVIRSIDNFFTKVFAVILKVSAYGFCLFIAGFTIFGTPLVFIEYEEGLTDLDMMEVGLMVLMFLLLWRFWQRGFELNMTYWQRIKKLSIIITAASLSTLLVQFAMLLDVVEMQGMLTEAAFTMMTDKAFVPETIFILFCLYAFTPISDGIISDEIKVAVEEVSAEDDKSSNSGKASPWEHQSPESQSNGWQSASSDNSNDAWSKKEDKS